jgi:hypothetical protein
MHLARRGAQFFIMKDLFYWAYLLLAMLAASSLGVMCAIDDTKVQYTIPEENVLIHEPPVENVVPIYFAADTAYVDRMFKVRFGKVYPRCTRTRTGRVSNENTYPFYDISIKIVQGEVVKMYFEVRQEGVCPTLYEYKLFEMYVEEYRYSLWQHSGVPCRSKYECCETH